MDDGRCISGACERKDAVNVNLVSGDMDGKEEDEDDVEVIGEDEYHEDDR